MAVKFTDADGNDLHLVSATYRVVDDNSNELRPTTSFDISETTLIIPPELNQIASIEIDKLTSEQMDEVRLNEVRVIEFELTLDDGNIYPYDIAYALVPRERLVVGLNSFQTLRQAYLSAMSVPNTTVWNTATEDDRIAAMIEARLRICSLRFRDVTVGQSYLGESKSIGDLGRLPPREFSALTARFRKALCLAQIAEAEEILGGGDQSSLNRRNGLVSQTIGETQEIYRSAKPVDMQVSKTALRYLSPFISLSQQIGRAG